jgi:lipopolysaccharide export system permease protein
VTLLKVNENKKKISTTTPTCFFDKFVIAYACFMMFFLETPLGHHKKRGLGFTYYICSSNLYFFPLHQHFRKENSTEMECLLLWGVDVVIILSPLAILLTISATNDIGLINMDVILSPFQNYFKLFPSKNK